MAPGGRLEAATVLAAALKAKSRRHSVLPLLLQLRSRRLSLVQSSTSGSVLEARPDKQQVTSPERGQEEGKLSRLSGCMY